MEKNTKPWYKKWWVWLIIFYVLGLISKEEDPAISSNEVDKVKSDCSLISGRYTGSSKMGYTSGTASIIIKDDCSSILTYDQGFDGETEHGVIFMDETSYKFKSTSGGGTYNLIVSENLIILKAYSWECILRK